MAGTETTKKNKHFPGFSHGVLGCIGYDSNGNVAFVADCSDKYKDLGIIEGSFVFAQSLSDFEEGKLNVFSVKEEGSDCFHLSRTLIPGKYVGRVIGVFTNLMDQD